LLLALFVIAWTDGWIKVKTMHSSCLGSSVVFIEGTKTVADVDESDWKRDRERLFVLDSIMMDRKALEHDTPLPVIFVAFDS
jgi:hypothetical protein